MGYRFLRSRYRKMIKRKTHRRTERLKIKKSIEIVTGRATTPFNRGNRAMSPPRTSRNTALILPQGLET